jgi:hypothetical protein
MNDKDYSMKVGNQELKFSIMEWKCIYNTLKQDIPEIEDNFYDSIVLNLKKEADKLNKKLNDIRENNKDMNLYISTLKSLKETLDLINKYDWKLMYSTYGLKEQDSENRNRMISVWEQNHDCQIRNHKMWKIVDDSIENKYDNNNFIKIGETGVDNEVLVAKYIVDYFKTNLVQKPDILPDLPIYLIYSIPLADFRNYGIIALNPCIYELANKMQKNNMHCARVIEDIDNNAEVITLKIVLESN